MSKTVHLLKQHIGTSSGAIKNALELFNEACMNTRSVIVNNEVFKARILKPLQKGLDLRVCDVHIFRASISCTIKFNISKKKNRNPGFSETHSLDIVYKFDEDSNPYITRLSLRIDLHKNVYRCYYFNESCGYVKIRKMFKFDDYKGRESVTKYFYNIEGQEK